MSHKARDYMSKNFLTFSPEMDIIEAVGQLVDRNYAGGFVVDKLGSLVGVLSEVDALKAAIHGAYHASWGGRVADVMRAEFTTVDVDDSIMHVAKMFAGGDQYYYRGFPVMKHNRVVGRIILRDVLRALREMSR
ncbi:MAG: CBS domain-containing protein [Gammaproteobacteria bacterium]